MQHSEAQAREGVTAQLNPCLMCYLRYARHGVGYSAACSLYADLASLGLTSMDEHGKEVCGKLEILLRDVEQLRAGGSHATYTECAQRIVREGL